MVNIYVVYASTRKHFCPYYGLNTRQILFRTMKLLLDKILSCVLICDAARSKGEPVAVKKLGKFQDFLDVYSTIQIYWRLFLRKTLKNAVLFFLVIENVYNLFIQQWRFSKQSEISMEKTGKTVHRIIRLTLQ